MIKHTHSLRGMSVAHALNACAPALLPPPQEAARAAEAERDMLAYGRDTLRQQVDLYEAAQQGYEAQQAALQVGVVARPETLP